MMGTMSAELAILLAWAMLWLESVNAFIFGREEFGASVFRSHSATAVGPQPPERRRLDE
jgi:hypothetical protein